MKTRSKIFLALISIVVIGIVAFPAIKNYMVNNIGKRDIKSETTAFTLTSTDIVAEFTSNTEASNKKYLEKPVAVSGTVTSVKDKEVILDNTVNCNFLVADATLKNGQKVTIKGRVVGYDDLLGEVKLDQCNLSTNK
ncbi:OB-fold protein [Flavobacterium sp.]|uniref:OB-fold protein n=1 Tax=Flavobacterium sp. TaxID=239 RepID=UPI002FD98A7A